MNKKILSVLLVLFLVFSFAFADEQWWVGQKISSYKIDGLNAVSSSTIEDILYSYKNQIASADLIAEIQSELTSVEGIKSVSTGATKSKTDESLILVFSFKEFPKVGTITVDGNSKIKDSSVKDVIDDLETGDFINLTTSKAADNTVTAIQNLYKSKGFGTVPVTFTYNEHDGVVDYVFTVKEGIQTRVMSITFAGNTNVSSTELKKQISSTKKTLFGSGYFNQSTVEEDVNSIMKYYLNLGYIDVAVDYSTSVCEVQNKPDEYNDIDLSFTIEEGEKWVFAGMDITGNTLFSTEEIQSLVTSVVGTTVNYTNVQSDYESIQDLYFNNGYITTPIYVTEERDEENKTVAYHLEVTEGEQSIIERIDIKGLDLTKEYVMRRELTLSEGDVFSKAKLITCLQNLYNTGLLSDVNYDIAYGNTENGIVLTFIVEEGSHSNIQFGATFGGNVTGFPISGFLQWADTNLGGRGQELDISTTLSPDSQNASVTFGDSWVKDLRWSNSVTLSVSHTKYTDELQKGTKSPSYSDEDYDDNVFPYGYDSYSQWEANDFAYPSSDKLMDYEIFNASVAYTSGYTWIYDNGRLTVSGGLSIGLNKSKYDTKNELPLDKMIYKYGLKWQFSNSISASFQWDGRDYVNNTTKGYVLGASINYAGGVLGGLSNYIKLTLSGAGYKKLFEVGPEDNRKNIMFCASSTASFMLPQYYKDSDSGVWDWYAASHGASRYEMLYIDGMTMARGFDAVIGQSILWDNTFEVSYPLKENVVNAEVFVSATGLKASLKGSGSLNWYFAAGAGVKLKITGFPLGLYIVKNATSINGNFQFDSGSIFYNEKNPNSGLKIVLAISTSLI